jgi:hypothetical protein
MIFILNFVFTIVFYAQDEQNYITLAYVLNNF